MQRCSKCQFFFFFFNCYHSACLFETPIHYGPVYTRMLRGKPTFFVLVSCTAFITHRPFKPLWVFACD
ncbi:hypothetical protein AB205_0191430 [Aquarana catesbeiana]|uniref:Uncharacterized protein n=1 Tax=Aquarana catesbeiana TaxID=8400 RepID=A0A2G9S2B4_AQUCT|nr:hypothetical protein AB205_0191430 [Aquarana catesbeiana]